MHVLFYRESNKYKGENVCTILIAMQAYNNYLQYNICM